MVWECFSARKAPQLKFIERNMNSVQYCEILSNVIVRFAESAYQGEWRIQQDNASMHVFLVTSELFQDMVISVLDRPACIPDLIYIENL